MRGGNCGRVRIVAEVAVAVAVASWSCSVASRAPTNGLTVRKGSLRTISRFNAGRSRPSDEYDLRVGEHLTAFRAALDTCASKTAPMHTVGSFAYMWEMTANLSETMTST